MDLGKVEFNDYGIICSESCQAVVMGREVFTDLWSGSLDFEISHSSFRE